MDSWPYMKNLWESKHLWGLLSESHEWSNYAMTYLFCPVCFNRCSKSSSDLECRVTSNSLILWRMLATTWMSLYFYFCYQRWSEMLACYLFSYKLLHLHGKCSRSFCYLLCHAYFYLTMRSVSWIQNHFHCRKSLKISFT